MELPVDSELQPSSACEINIYTVLSHSGALFETKARCFIILHPRSLIWMKLEAIFYRSLILTKMHGFPPGSLQEHTVLFARSQKRPEVEVSVLS